jgi:hypothetical protein
MGRAEVQPSVNVLMRADPIVHYTIAFTVTGHQAAGRGRGRARHFAEGLANRNGREIRLAPG